MSGNNNIISPAGAHSHDTLGGKIIKESGGFMVAEMASAATGLGVVAVADMLIPKPILKFASQTVSKIIVEPYLDTIESTVSKFCKLKECQVDPDVPRAERAERIAKTMIIFGGAYVASMIVKLGTRRKMNEIAGIIEHVPAKLPASATLWDKFKYFGGLQFMAPQEKLIFALDEGVHLGSLYLLNNQLAPFTDDMIRRTTRMINKTTGLDEHKSHEIANMAWIWEAANGLGAAAAITAIAGNHAGNWSTKGWLGKVLANKLPSEPLTHVEKLAAQSAANAATAAVPHA
jgi:hypothetical protein